jgi:hypothetical protein
MASRAFLHCFVRLGKLVSQGLVNIVFQASWSTSWTRSLIGFPSGYRSCLFSFFSHLVQLSLWASIGWCGWSTHTGLGGEAVSPLFQRKGFLLAEVQFSIIGVNFLRHYGLLVDPGSNQASHSSPPFPGDLPLQAPALQPLLQASLVDPHGLFMSSSSSTPLLELSLAGAST